MEKIILHIDMDNYFASVECLDRKELLDVPMAVCGDPSKHHGIVLSRNAKAKEYNIIAGESSKDAKSKCKELVIIYPNYEKYLEYAKKARSIYKEYSPLIYPYGLDEAWVDITNLTSDFNQAYKIATEIKNRILNELGLIVTIGISFNYVFSKLATELNKPNGLGMIPYENFKETVKNIPAFNLLFIGAHTRTTLYKMGILTIGDLANFDVTILSNKLGKKGYTLHEFANGNDTSFNPNNNEEDIKSLGNTITPLKAIDKAMDAYEFLYVLSNILAKRLNKHSYKARGITITIKYIDLTSITKQMTMDKPVDDINTIFYYSCKLFDDNYNQNLKIRSLTIRVNKFISNKIEQLSLFIEEPITNPKIEKVIARLKDKYKTIGLEKNAYNIEDEVVRKERY